MRIRYRPIGLLLAGLGVAFAHGAPEFTPLAAALAQESGAKEHTVRPEIGKPVQAALDLL